jgi:hypothetical protein
MLSVSFEDTGSCGKGKSNMSGVMNPPIKYKVRVLLEIGCSGLV